MVLQLYILMTSTVSDARCRTVDPERTLIKYTQAHQEAY
jgi:hypothetical protein